MIVEIHARFDVGEVWVSIPPDHDVVLEHEVERLPASKPAFKRRIFDDVRSMNEGLEVEFELDKWEPISIRVTLQDGKEYHELQGPAVEPSLGFGYTLHDEEPT